MNMGRIGRWADRVVVREYGYDVMKGEEKRWVSSVSMHGGMGDMG